MTPVVDGDDQTPPLSLQQAADQLGVHYMTAYRYVRTGRLPATRRAGRWSVAQADVVALARQRSARATTAGVQDDRDAGGDQDLDQTGGPYRERLLACLVAGDEPGGWSVVESALVAGMRPDRVHLDVLAPCLREVGARWAAGTLDVGTEHVATATAARLAARLAPLDGRRGRTRGTLVLAGAPGEQHGLPMTLLTNVLRSRGWRVVELGADTPAFDLVETARSADQLVAVAVSVGSDDTLDAAAAVLADVREALPGVPVLVGGPAIADAPTARRLGGDAWGADADEVDALLTSLRALPRDGAGPTGGE